MAVKITQYQQQTLPQSGGMPRANPAQEVGIGEALSGLGTTAVHLAAVERRQQEIDAEKQRIIQERQQAALDKQQAEEGKAEAHGVLADARLQFTELMIKSQETAAPGATGFTPGMLKQFDDYATTAIKGRTNPVSQKLLEAGFQDLRTQIGQNALQFEAQARIDNRINGLEAGINKTAQAVLTDPKQRATALAEQLAYIDAMEIPPKQKEALKERAAQNIDSAALNGEITNGRNSTRSLDGILERMGKGEFAGVPANQLAAAEARVGNFKNTLIVKAEAAERRRLAALDQAERRLSWYVENGKDIPPAEFNSFVKQAKGTPFEAAATGIVAEQKSIAQLTHLPPEQMVAKVDEIEASYGPTPSKEQLVHVDKLKRYANNSIKQLRDSPLDYAVQREGASVPPLDLSKPDTWGETLGQRVPILRETSARTGVAPKGLLPQEALSFSAAIKQAKPDQQSTMLSKLRAGFGDDKVFKATMQQIAPDNPVVAAAGVAASRGLETDRGRRVADLMLRGNALLRQDTGTDGKPLGGKLIPMPKEEDLSRAFVDFEKDAFAGKEVARSTAYQAAKAIYAAKASEEGDYSGEFNSRRWDAAIKLSTGGIEKHNSRAIVLPFGMDYGAFKDGVKARTVALVASGKIDPSFTPDKLRNLPLENAGDGRYFMRVGDGVLVDKSGQPAILDFNQ